jgi:hypothetical protein
VEEAGVTDGETGRVLPGEQQEELVGLLGTFFLLDGLGSIAKKKLGSEGGGRGKELRGRRVGLRII